MASLYNFDFNGGESLAALGFTTDTPANVAGVGIGGSYAMSWTGGDDLGRARYPIDTAMGSSKDGCFSGVWIPKVATDWALFALQYFTGVSYIFDLQFYTDNDGSMFLIQRDNTEIWRSATGFYALNTPLYWRLYVKASTRSGGGWLNDGEVTLWTGPSAGAMTQQFATTTALIEDSFTQPYAWSHVFFGPQGILDNLVGDTGECSIEAPGGSDDGGDISEACCAKQRAVDKALGNGIDPIGVLPPWIASCEGGGEPDTVSDLAPGEVF